METEKKICVYIGGFDMPEKNAAANLVRIYGRLLGAIGYKIVYIGVNHSLSYKTDVLETGTQVDGNDYYAIGYPGNLYEWIRYAIDEKKYVKVIEKLGNVDTIILYNLNAIPLNKLRMYCKKRNIKSVANATEWYSSKGGGFIWGMFRGLDTWYRMRVVQKRFDRVIVISRYLEKFYAADRKRKVLRLPVLFDSKEERWSDRKEKSKNKLCITYAGTPGNKERLDVIIEALKMVTRPTHFDVLGLNAEDYFKMYGEDDWVKCNKDIVFHGRVSRNEVIEVIKSSDYTCFIRNNCRVANAGFPSKLTESIACGTPVITNDTGDVSVYISGGVNGYVLPSEPDVKVLREVIENAVCDMRVEGTMLDYRMFEDAVRNFLDA